MGSLSQSGVRLESVGHRVGGGTEGRAVGQRVGNSVPARQGSKAQTGPENPTLWLALSQTGTTNPTLLHNGAREPDPVARNPTP